VAAPIILLGLLGVAFYLSDRANSLSRFVTEKSTEEVRLQSFDTVMGMLETYGTFGAGFGSFARAFQIVEPDALLRSSYFNHAHNDWLQFPIEGGLPAVVILLIGLGWLIKQLVVRREVGHSPGDEWQVERLAIGIMFALLAIGSIVDYPLRTPSLALVAVLFLVILRNARMREA
jgi:O-antigen ligase